MLVFLSFWNALFQGTHWICDLAFQQILQSVSQSLDHFFFFRLWLVNMLSLLTPPPPLEVHSKYCTLMLMASNEHADTSLFVPSSSVVSAHPLISLLENIPLSDMCHSQSSCYPTFSWVTFTYNVSILEQFPESEFDNRFILMKKRNPTLVINQYISSISLSWPFWTLSGTLRTEFIPLWNQFKIQIPI